MNKKFKALILGGLFFAINIASADTLTQTYPIIGIAPSFGVEFFVYLLNFSIVGGTIIATVGLVYQGINILTAGENAGQITTAKKSIKGLALGLTILLGSTLMLKAINPELLNMNLVPFLGDIINDQGKVKTDLDRPEVQYTEVPVGAILESILNAVSTSPTQAYNYSSIKTVPGVSHTEEICYLYDEYGNAIDKNGDGSITEMDEYQGVDFSICMNELLKAVEHKLLYLNGGKYRCGIAGNNDEDSPVPIPNIGDYSYTPSETWNKYWNADNSDYLKTGKTALGVNYHDWDDYWETCKYFGNCEGDGLQGIINDLKKYIRDGCICSATDERTSDLYDPEYVGCEGTTGGGINPRNTFYCHSGAAGCPGEYCDINCNDGGDGCCGGPRGRSTSCQAGFNNISNPGNPYLQHDPCLQRRSMDCMREFINTIVYGDINAEDYCPAQEAKQGPASPIKMGWQCNDFTYSKDPEVTKAKTTEFLLADYQRLISFKKYYETRMEDLEKAEKYLMKDKRVELYSKAEFQELQKDKKERYSFSQDGLKLSFTYETTTYRKRFNCASYEDAEKLNEKNVYEDDEYRANIFTCNWGEDQYGPTQQVDKLVKIQTGELISNLHVDKSMEITGPSSEDLEDEEEDRLICSRAEIETLEGKNALFNNITSACPGNYDVEKREMKGAPGAMFDTAKRRFVQWKDDIYEKGGFAYLDENDEKYWTGEDMSNDGDPLTFYVLRDPETVVDPYYTGRDKMPYYLKPAFIDYSQYSENSAIDTEVGTERGFLLPALIPVGQLSYHTKIYTKQMIRTIDRTLEQMEAAIIALDNIANVYVEGGAAEGGGDYSGISQIDKDTGEYLNGGARSTGCDCENCKNKSDCHCASWSEDCGCIQYVCTDTCSACKPQTQVVSTACSKVLRYSKFIVPSYYDYYGANGNPNAEPLVDDVIRDDLPGSLKLIVHNMSCHNKSKSKEYDSYLVAAAFGGYVSEYGIKLKAGSTKINWDGEKQVLISSSPKTITDVSTDDYLIINNITNQKSKQYGPISGSVWKGHVDIMDLLSVGDNELEFYVLDQWKAMIGWNNIYVLIEKDAEILPCACAGSFPLYSPPSGYEVVECNAWNRDLKEERTCADYKNDIVVILKRK